MKPTFQDLAEERGGATAVYCCTTAPVRDGPDLRRRDFPVRIVRKLPNRNRSPMKSPKRIDQFGLVGR